MNDPKDLWKNQEREHPNMTLILLRQKLQEHSRKVRLKAVVTLGIGLTALGLFIWQYLRTQQSVGRAGWGIVIVATVFLLLPLLYENRKLVRSGNLASDAGLTTCLDFYRNMLERHRRSRVSPRRRLNGAGTVLLFVGLGVLLIQPIRVFYESLQQPGGPNYGAWIPLVILLVLWLVAYIGIGKRDRNWLRREFEILEALEREN